MKKSLKPLILIGMTFIAVQGLLAQSIPTLEMQRNAPPLGTANYGPGASLNPVVTEFRNDNLNNSVFSAHTPQSTFTVSLTNQQFTGLSYGTANYNGLGVSTLQTTGLVFGIGPSLATDPTPQGGNPYERYNIIGEYGGNGGPTNAMFTSNPTATGAQLGTGITVANAGLNSLNGATEVFTTAQALYNNAAYPVGSRVYFGDLVLTFSQPVKNPVIHVAGLGGSYRYLPFGAPNIPGNYVSTFFSTELELVNTGVTSTLMSSNTFMSLSGNNILNSNNVNPNGGSINDPTEFINNLGAATGSIRVNGTVQQLVYRVYLQSGTGSQFAWSASGTLSAGPGAARDPFTGDIWYVAASYNRPTQQITGIVYNDKDGLTDNNINQSGGLPNVRTNVGGTLHANLLNTAGQAVATVPIGDNGAYLFDNVPVGTYTVQLTTIASAGTYAAPAAPPATVMPAGWFNTGEFIGSGVGSDGVVNSQSAPVILLAGDIRTEVNFGIERLPDSKNFNSFIALPVIGDVAILNTTGFTPKFGPLPVLTGSDPEDMPIEAVLTGKTLRITRLPAFGILRYNGIAVTLNQTIPSFNPALLTLFFNAVLDNFVDFQYAYVDAAGFPDPTPATYRLAWSGCCPIFLSEFIANKTDCTANLTWKTATEINGDRFEVEISTVNNPTYTKVGTIAAAGNSSTPKSYSFSYPMQQGVVYYFRLKMVDKDGSFMYSEIRSLSCTKGKTGIVIAPNPVRTSFTVTGMENGRNSVVVYAANGQLVKAQEIKQNQGTVNVSYLAPGMYTVKVTSETGNTVVNKLIKY